MAHNARFDVGFLRHEWRLAGHTAPCLLVVDTLALAQAHYSFRHNSLAAIDDELGIPTDHPAPRHGRRVYRLAVLARFVADMRQAGPVILAHVMYPIVAVRCKNSPPW